MCFLFILNIFNFKASSEKYTKQKNIHRQHDQPGRGPRQVVVQSEQRAGSVVQSRRTRRQVEGHAEKHDEFRAVRKKLQRSSQERHVRAA